MCPPQINLPDFHFKCSQSTDCAIAGDNCRSCTNQVVINKKFLKEFDERDQLLRGRLECSVACEACDNKSVKVYCVERKCTLQAPPETAVINKKSKKQRQPAEARPEDAVEDSAALEKEDIY